VYRKSLLVGMKRELIHAEELEARKRRKEDPGRSVYMYGCLRMYYVHQSENAYLVNFLLLGILYK
jgi:hypothetical protein